jgi:hypothetical protein
MCWDESIADARVRMDAGLERSTIADVGGPGTRRGVSGPRPMQAARKPDSVLDDHSSRRRVATPLQQPTRKFRLIGRSQPELSCLGASGRYARARWRVRARSLPIWSCSVWGLPCGGHCWPSGALLPHLFTLTVSRLRDCRRYILCCTGRLCALKHKSRTLSGTLPCGVRTFLPLPNPCGPGGSDRPAACKPKCSS